MFENDQRDFRLGSKYNPVVSFFKIIAFSQNIFFFDAL